MAFLLTVVWDYMKAGFQSHYDRQGVAALCDI